MRHYLCPVFVYRYCTTAQGFSKRAGRLVGLRMRSSMCCNKHNNCGQRQGEAP